MRLDWPLLFALTTAHLLADFAFQSDWNVRNKKKPVLMGKHVLIVATVSYVLAGDWKAWRVPAVIGLTHLLIDTIKIGLGGEGLVAFAVDQGAHLLVIVAVAYSFPLAFPIKSFWAPIGGVTFVKALWVVSGVVTTVKVGAVVVGKFVKPYLDDLTGMKKSESSVTSSKEPQRGLTKGGKVIGELERALIFFLVMIGKPESIAFLVAAKSIFRFGELQDRENRAEAEYITIGTMMSFIWGLFVSWVTWLVYRKM